MAAIQPPTCHLLRIPRELRDEIYAHCLASDEGYHYHAETNTLRYPDDKAIDVALLQTCKQVAAEATECALRKNTMTFKTHIALVEGVEFEVGSSLQSEIYGSDIFLRRLHRAKVDACRTAFGAYGTEEIAIHLSKQYPQSGICAQFQSMVQTKEGHRKFPERLTTSEIHMYPSDQPKSLRKYPGTAVVKLHELSYTDYQALQDTLQLIHSRFGLPKWLDSWSLIRWFSDIKDRIGLAQGDHHWIRRSAFEIASSNISAMAWLPWITPTTAQYNEAINIVDYLTSVLPSRPRLDHPRDLRYYESGTSQCIRFLGMLQHKQRCHLRHLVIREDRNSAAQSRCHAHGLIPYLKDLPRLRVVHRVDMWSAIFFHSDAMLGWVNASRIPSRIPSLQGKPTCGLSCAAYKIIDWITEAMDLRHAGMPLSAYSLHLEANINTAQRVWNAIKLLAALALANRRRYHQTDDPSFLSIGTTWKDYDIDFDGRQEWRLVTSVRLILSGDSTVRLSCPIGSLKEFEEEAYRIGNELRDQPESAWRGYTRSFILGSLDTEDYDFTPLHELYHDLFWR